MDSYVEQFTSKLASYNETHTFYEIVTENALLISVVLASSTILYYYRKYTYWSRRGIVGPTPIPPFGTGIYDLTHSRNRAHRIWFKKYGKVYGAYNGTKPILVVADPQIVKDIMVKDAHIWPNHMFFEFGSTWQKKMLFFQRDEPWKELRSLMAFTLTSGKIKKMYNLMKSSSDDLIGGIHKSIDKGEAVDIKIAYGCFTLDVIARTAFATKFDSEESENKYRKELITILIEEFKRFPIFRFVIIAFIPKSILHAINFKFSDMKLQNHLGAISRKLLESRRKDHSHRRQDLLQLFMDLNKEEMTVESLNDVVEGDVKESHHVANYDKQELNDALAEIKTMSNGFSNAKKNVKVKLDDDDIIGNCILLFIAGYETTSSLLSFASYALACHPDIQEKLYQEVKAAREKELQENQNNFFEYESVLSMELLDGVISETLRMFPPAPIMDRESNADYKIQSLGITLPAGSTVVFPFMSIHYNPEFYPEPKSFQPSRFLPENRHKLTPYAYIPFGAGIRHCLGMRFALAEAKLALSRIVYEFKITPTAGPKARFPPKLAKTFSMLRSDELYLSYTKRN